MRNDFLTVFTLIETVYKTYFLHKKQFTVCYDFKNEYVKTFIISNSCKTIFNILETGLPTILSSTTVQHSTQLSLEGEGGWVKFQPTFSNQNWFNDIWVQLMLQHFRHTSLSHAEFYRTLLSVVSRDCSSEKINTNKQKINFIKFINIDVKPLSYYKSYVQAVSLRGHNR